MRKVESWWRKTPNTKIQTAKKSQAPNSQRAGRHPAWNLVFEASLAFDVWDLVFHFSSFIAMITAPISAAVRSSATTSSGSTYSVINFAPIFFTLISAATPGLGPFSDEITALLRTV